MAEENNQYTFENEEYRKTYWHTCSHVLAQAMKRLHPEVKLAIGPSIDNGFYYDFDTPEPFTEGQLEELEAEMRKICKEKLKLERFELPRAEAVAFMEEKGEPFKVELINDLPEDAVISFYKQGEFTDLCAGPHLDSTGRIKGNAIKLTACNAAYWRGDSSRETLQRIYGIAFPKKDELDEYLAKIEEAKKRDHRRLGKELGLFMLRDEGPGFPFSTDRMSPMSRLFNVVKRRSALASDTVIGVFSSTAVALGIFLSTLGGRSFTRFNNLLIGDILSVEPGKVGLLALILLAVVLLWLVSFNQLMLSAVHPALADSRGIRVFWQETVFSMAIAVVVTLSMTWVGLLVINSLLVLPGAAARNVARNMRQYHLFSLLGAVLAGIAGLMTSYYVGGSAGAAITLYLAAWFALTFLLRKK